MARRGLCADRKPDLILLNPDAYARLLRPLLFRLSPETAQKVADSALSLEFLWKAASALGQRHDDRLATKLGPITLRNPVGLAAGYDKNCEYLPALSTLGFGYLVGGTVTLDARAGNPKPRMRRIPPRESLVNALGFPGRGLERAESKLTAAAESGLAAQVMVSVSGTEINDVATCHARLEPFVAAIEVNISSPNTQGLRVFQERSALKRLLDRVNERRRKPLFVKLPPYAASPTPGVPESLLYERAAGEEARNTTLALVDACIEAGVDGVTVANTRPVADASLAMGTGGLSGRALFQDTLLMVRETREHTGSRLAINACGGVLTGEDVWELLKAGADTVQLLTAMIYRGPGAARAISRELTTRMMREGVSKLPAHP